MLYIYYYYPIAYSINNYSLNLIYFVGHFRPPNSYFRKTGISVHTFNMKKLPNNDEILNILRNNYNFSELSTLDTSNHKIIKNNKLSYCSNEKIKKYISN